MFLKAHSLLFSIIWNLFFINWFEETRKVEPINDSKYENKIQETVTKDPFLLLNKRLWANNCYAANNYSSTRDGAAW